MDPDKALDDLRRLMADEDNGIPQEVYEAFTGLDNWLNRGGFLPHDWAHRRSDSMIVMSPKETTDLLNTLRHTERMTGLRKLRVMVEGDRVKFKVNENTWSPPLGLPQEQY